jgi:hypothetical protein
VRAAQRFQPQAFGVQRLHGRGYGWRA